MGTATAPAPQKPRGRLFTWVASRPKRAFWITAIIALMIGIGIGGAAGTDQSALDRAKADAARFRSEAVTAKTQLAAVTRERDGLERQVDSAQDRADTAEAAVKQLTAKAELPDLTGDDVSAARSNDVVTRLGWKIRTVTRLSATAPPGSVIDQRPNEGDVLKAGRSITLTVARKPPPKPKQWVTTQTLQGDSDTKTEEFRVPRGYKARLVYDMPQDGNNAITLYRAPTEYVDLLLNEIGPQHGSTRMYEPGTFYLDVMGAYNIEVQIFKRPS